MKIKVLMQDREEMPEDMRVELLAAMAMEPHYPCRCHDWAWLSDHWELIPRHSKSPQGLPSKATSDSPST